MLPLPDLQRQFFDAITGGNGVAATASSAGVVVAAIQGRGPLDSRDRLEIYARMYGARLVDALAEDYPRVATLVGWEWFHEIAHAYVAGHPSRHPSLRWFGERFPAFLAMSGLTRPGFLVDLARLEWARVMAFDALDVELLSLEALRRYPPDAWADLRLRAVPALDVMSVAWPVHEIWDAPEMSDSAPWQPAACWLRVWRQGDRVFQATMDVPERLALAHVQAGDDFGSLCAGLATVMPAEQAAGAAGALVLRWIEDELLAADDPGP